jgi:hypothetical protein
VTEDDGASVAQQVDDRGDLAAGGETRSLDHVEGLVQNHELAFLEMGGVEIRVHVDPHALAVDDDLRSAVLVAALEDTVAVGRRAELVDLFLQELDLLLRLLEDPHQLLVLTLRIAQLIAREVVAPPERLILRQYPIKPAPELHRIPAEESHRFPQIVDFLLNRSSHDPFTLRIGLVGFVRSGGRDATHDVPYEAFPAGLRIELAHEALSRFTPPPSPWEPPIPLQGLCRKQRGPRDATPLAPPRAAARASAPSKTRSRPALLGGEDPDPRSSRNATSRLCREDPLVFDLRCPRGVG